MPERRGKLVVAGLAQKRRRSATIGVQPRDHFTRGFNAANRPKEGALLAGIEPATAGNLCKEGGVEGSGEALQLANTVVAGVTSGAHQQNGGAHHGRREPPGAL